MFTLTKGFAFGLVALPLLANTPAFADNYGKSFNDVCSGSGTVLYSKKLTSLIIMAGDDRDAYIELNDSDTISGEKGYENSYRSDLKLLSEISTAFNNGYSVDLCIDSSDHEIHGIQISKSTKE